MRKKHKTLNDYIFRHSVYMNIVNRETNCDFRKEHKKEYKFMLDTFSTLILLNNCFFSDSNLSIKDKIENAITLIEKYIYLDLDKNENKKYSSRFIEGIPEKHSTHLYRRINEWYEILVIPNRNIEMVLDDIEKEIDRIDNVSFDSVIKDNFKYQKNKDNDYKIFISKFSDLYVDKNSFLQNYIEEYNDEHKEKLTDEEIYNISTVYNALAKANNGLMPIIHKKDITIQMIDKRDTPQTIYKIYLDTLGIDNHSPFFKTDALVFFLEAIHVYKNGCIQKGMPFEVMIANYELASFIYLMEQIIMKKNFKVNDGKIEKIIEELKQVYNIMNSSRNIRSNSKKCYEIIQNRIKKNEDYFIRVS